MHDLTDDGRRRAEALAQRYGVSVDAVVTLLRAVAAGGGTMAQFSHPDLGGMGQWSQGGMIMVGDMFNHGLKSLVDGLCNELSSMLRDTSPFMPVRAPQSSWQGQGGQSQSQGSWQGQGGGYQGQHQGGGVSLFVGGNAGSWWPEDLGSPGSTGSQNDLRYAFFPGSRRLAIEIGGRMTVYDTGDHQLYGFSQQQGGGQSLSFTSQYGLVRVADLPIVQPNASRLDDMPPHEPLRDDPAPAGASPQMPEWPAQPTAPIPERPASVSTAEGAPASGQGPDDILGRIERMADLMKKGILTEAEFAAKKTELLARL